MNPETWAYWLAGTFILAGVGIGFLPIHTKRFISKIRTWQQVEAHVIKIEETTHDYTYYHAKIEYSANDKIVKTNLKNPFNQQSDIPGNLLVHVNPNDPRDIYCEFDLSGMQAMAPTGYLMAACFVFGGIGLFVYLQFFPH